MQKSAFRKILTWYRETIAANCYRRTDELNGLPYWQDKLFGVILTFLLPFSLLAIIPGVIMSLIHGLTFLAVFDSLVLLCLIFIAFHKTLTIFSRKLIFILIFYSISVVLLYFLGSFGPGLLYLLSATVFTVLIFSRGAAYWSVAINCVICIVFALAIHFKFLSGPLLTEYSLGAWIAVSSNLLLLSITITALFPALLKGLQITIEEQQALKSALKTEQQSLQKALLDVSKKNKELEEFAYMTSHDLQEPLRMITGFLGMLEKNSKAVLDEKSRGYINYAIDGADRMKQIISDLLDYSMAETKQKTLESLNLNDLLIHYQNENKETMENLGASITWEPLPSIHADKLSLQHLFQNLLGNSLKYHRKDTAPVISIHCKETNSHWELKIADNGIGIPQDQFSNIFTAFKRLHDKSEYPGTGLGLAICKKIVENHNGQIWVESKPDSGSIFYFTISKNIS